MHFNSYPTYLWLYTIISVTSSLPVLVQSTHYYKKYYNQNPSQNTEEYAPDYVEYEHVESVSLRASPVPLGVSLYAENSEDKRGSSHPAAAYKVKCTYDYAASVYFFHIENRYYYLRACL